MQMGHWKELQLLFDGQSGAAFHASAGSLRLPALAYEIGESPCQASLEGSSTTA